jgi:uroporphyrinogen-III synthase
LKEFGLTPLLVAPEPNTTERLIAEIDSAGLDLTGARVDIQEYGEINAELAAALAQRGARIQSVTVYMWQLPEDLKPLETAVEQLAGGNVALALFTSARQVIHLLEVAERLGKSADLLWQLKHRVVVASIGPVTTEALVARGLEADVEPPHPKMGAFVTHVASEWADLSKKNSAA